MSQLDHQASIEWMQGLFPAINGAEESNAKRKKQEIVELIDAPPAEIEALKKWILKVCELCQVKPTQLARGANLSPSTINRLLKGSNKSASLNANSVHALEIAGKSLAAKFIDEKVESLYSSFQEHYIEPETSAHINYSNEVMRIPVLEMLGINNTWMQDTFQSQHKYIYDIFVPIPLKYKSSHMVAFQIMDMSDENDDGSQDSLLVCLPTWSNKISLTGSERVIVVQREHPETVSAGIRDLSRDGRDYVWLMPLEQDAGTLEPRFLSRAEIPLVKGKVGLAFVVIASYRTF